MESRWNISLTDTQKAELLHIDFIYGKRKLVPEIPESIIEPADIIIQETKFNLKERHIRRIKFWSNFVEYCKLKGVDGLEF